MTECYDQSHTGQIYDGSRTKDSQLFHRESERLNQDFRFPFQRSNQMLVNNFNEGLY